MLSKFGLQTHTAAAFYMGYRDPNSGPHAFKTHILFNLESLNSRTSVIVQTAISHYNPSYLGYTITTAFSKSPSLSPLLPHFAPPLLGLLYRCLSHLGMSPARNPINSKLPSVLPKPLDIIFFGAHSPVTLLHTKSSLPFVRKTSITYKSCHSWV